MGDAAPPLPILVRSAVEGDKNFIRSTWLRSYGASPLARVLGRKSYYSGHHALVSRLLTRHTVRVACSEDDPGVIVGWACVEPDNVVHYVYVREEFRRFGVARRLLDGMDARVLYTHRTDLCSQLPIPEGWWFDFYKAVAA